MKQANNSSNNDFYIDNDNYINSRRDWIHWNQVAEPAWTNVNLVHSGPNRTKVKILIVVEWYYIIWYDLLLCFREKEALQCVKYGTNLIFGADAIKRYIYICARLMIVHGPSYLQRSHQHRTRTWTNISSIVAAAAAAAANQKLETRKLIIWMRPVWFALPLIRINSIVSSNCSYKSALNYCLFDQFIGT